MKFPIKAYLQYKLITQSLYKIPCYTEKELIIINNKQVLNNIINSGYTYIALENGVQISSHFGHRVEYIVTDYRDGEEYFFDNYKEAESYMNLSLTDED